MLKCQQLALSVSTATVGMEASILQAFFEFYSYFLRVGGFNFKWRKSHAAQFGCYVVALLVKNNTLTLSFVVCDCARACALSLVFALRDHLCKLISPQGGVGAFLWRRIANCHQLAPTNELTNHAIEDRITFRLGGWVDGLRNCWGGEEWWRSGGGWGDRGVLVVTDAFSSIESRCLWYSCHRLFCCRSCCWRPNSRVVLLGALDGSS